MAGRTGRRGSVRQESNGTWSFTVDVADGTGRRRQTRRRGFPTRRAAQAAMTTLIAEMDKGVYVAPSRQTLKDFLESEWLPAIAPTIRPATLDSYTRVIRLHVSPMPVGSLALQDVDGPRLNVLYAQLLRAKPKGHGLSPRSVQYVHVILHRAFRDAVRWDRLFRNPCDAADPPRGLTRPRLRVWSADELANFLRLAHDDRLIALWHLIATTACAAARPSVCSGRTSTSKPAGCRSSGPSSRSLTTPRTAPTGHSVRPRPTAASASSSLTRALSPYSGRIGRGSPRNDSPSAVTT